MKEERDIVTKTALKKALAAGNKRMAEENRSFGLNRTVIRKGKLVVVSPENEIIEIKSEMVFKPVKLPAKTIKLF